MGKNLQKAEKNGQNQQRVTKRQKGSMAETWQTWPKKQQKNAKV